MSRHLDSLGWRHIPEPLNNTKRQSIASSASDRLLKNLNSLQYIFVAYLNRDSSYLQFHAISILQRLQQHPSFNVAMCNHVIEVTSVWSHQHLSIFEATSSKAYLIITFQIFPPHLNPPSKSKLQPDTLRSSSIKSPPCWRLSDRIRAPSFPIWVPNKQRFLSFDEDRALITVMPASPWWVQNNQRIVCNIVNNNEIFHTHAICSNGLKQIIIIHRHLSDILLRNYAMTFTLSWMSVRSKSVRLFEELTALAMAVAASAESCGLRPKYSLWRTVFDKIARAKCALILKEE